MQSPPSPRRGVMTTYHDPIQEKDTFYSTTQERRARAEMLASIAQREKDELVASSLNVQSALRGARDTLSKKQKLIADAQRDLATMAVERTKMLQSLAAQRHTLEEDIQSQHRIRGELESNVQKLQEEAADGRAQHQQCHTNIERLQRKVQSLQTNVKQLLNAVEAAGQEHVSVAANNKVQNDRLNNAVSDKEAAIALLIEDSKRKEKVKGASDVDHSNYCEKLRNAGQEIRNDMEERGKIIDSLRDRLDNMEREAEEASRRRRKNAEEQRRQELADRKALLQHLLSEKQDASRKIRSETTKKCEALRSDIDEEAKSLTALRDALTNGFETEIALHEEIKRAKSDLVGMDSLRERSHVADEAALIWKERGDALVSEVRFKMSLLDERAKTIESLKAQVAPLPDVEQAIAAHNNKATTYQRAKADMEAERAIAAVKRGEKEDSDNLRMGEIERDIEDGHREIQRHRDDFRERKAALEADIRVMESELKVAETKYHDTAERNKQLDQTLEHIARQRRILAEELTHRRDAARLAAQTLLSQLE